MAQGNNNLNTPNGLKQENKLKSNGDGGSGNALQVPNNLAPTS